MKKTPFLLAILAIALVIPASAQAAWTAGTYTGRTFKGGPITLVATKAPRSAVNGKLTLVRIGIVFTCTDGDRFQTVLTGFPKQNIVNGSYNATFTGSSGASRYVNRGTITRRRINGRTFKRATGTFTGRRTYNTEDQLDPNGTVTCTTGTVRYNIRKP